MLITYEYLNVGQHTRVFFHWQKKKTKNKEHCFVSLQDGVLLGRLITKYCPVDGIDPSNLQVRSTLKYCMWFRDLIMLLFVKHI